MLINIFKDNMIADNLVKGLTPYIQIAMGLAAAGILAIIVKEVIKKVTYEGSIAAGCSRRKARKNAKCAGTTCDISSASNDF